MRWGSSLIKKYNPVAGVVNAGKSLVGGDLGGAVENLVVGSLGPAGAVIDNAKQIPGFLGVNKTDTSGLNAAGEKAGDLYARALGEMSNAPYVPQTVQQRNVDQPVLSQNVERVGAVQTSAPTIAPTERVTAQNAQAVQAAPTQKGYAFNAEGASVNNAAGAQARAMQLDNVAALQDAAAGRGESAAQAQYARAMSDLTANQFAQAAQARGSSRAALMRSAMQNAGTAQQKAAFDTAAMRAGEMATARGQLTGAIGDVRGVDTTQAIRQAELAQDASKFNAGQHTQTSQFNAAQENTAGQGAAERGTAVNVGNANRDLAAGTTNATQANARATSQAGLQAGNDQANANRTLTADTTNAGAKNQRDETKAKIDTDVATGNANRGVQVDTTNTNAGLTANAHRVTEQGNVRDAALNAVRAEGDIAGKTADIDAGSAKRRSELAGGIINTGSAALSMLAMSDRRVKTDVERESDADVDDFLSALEAYAYRYKGESPQSPERHGVMAQDLEKSRIGRGLVHDSPWGKQVDTAGLTMALAGAVARKLRRA
jgi:hypothetical protein